MRGAFRRTHRAKIFRRDAEQAKTRAVSFERVHFFWADERCVPPADAESNFAIARKFLFAPLKIADVQIHRIRGEDSPEAAATAASTEITQIAPLNEDGQPILDIIFLGMGENGHVASLFTGEPDVLISDKAIYRAVKNSTKAPQIAWPEIGRDARVAVPIFSFGNCGSAGANLPKDIWDAEHGVPPIILCRQITRRLKNPDEDIPCAAFIFHSGNPQSFFSLCAQKIANLGWPNQKFTTRFAKSGLKRIPGSWAIIC